MKFGCHVSIKNGYLGAAKQIYGMGGAAFQYFPKNPRSLSIKKYNKFDAKDCKEFCSVNNIVSIAHTPYPTSLTPSEDKRDLTIASLVNDLEIAAACGSLGVVVHYGSKIQDPDPLASYHLMIDILDAVLNDWDGECKILLENNAGKPGTIGTTIEELTQVRNLTKKPEKIGFCLDTCHAFASGLWTGENSKDLLHKCSELGYLDNLHAIHLNNSKYPLNSGKDRHANIFKGGYIEVDHFKQLLNTLSEIPYILETPSDFGVSHEEEITQLQQVFEG